MIYLVGKFISLDGLTMEIGYCESAEDADEYCKQEDTEDNYFIIPLKKLSPRKVDILNQS